MKSVPLTSREDLPYISVVVCSYNGSATIRDTLNGLVSLEYPAFEVIVVNDGSNDNLASIVKEYPVQLISTPNRGLSNARNTGMKAAQGEIVAYIDDDAYPDPQWLHYLAYAYRTSGHACIGGPNLAPHDDGPIATCVANAPGGPVHVLLSDEIAEHVPGCNMTFRREVLMQIGGFDPIYRSAGDDVDVCWRIQALGETVGFHPSAIVWHHRRNSLKAYWKQQKGYGKAEALLEEKWPEKYNGFGHLAWAGRIYGNGFTLPIQVKKDKVFQGTWGTALFQSVYQPAPGMLNCIPLMPEWYLFIMLLGVLSVMGALWSSLLWAVPLLIFCVGVLILQATLSAYRNTSLPPAAKNKFKYRMVITMLHVVQPMARLYGRIKFGLTPWRKRKGSDVHVIMPLRSKEFRHWSEKWYGAEEWLMEIEKNMIGLKTRVKRGGDFDSYDFQTRNGVFAVNRSLLTIEEHGAGKQLIRMKAWTRPSKTFLISFLTLLALSATGFITGAIATGVIMGIFTLATVFEYLRDSAFAIATMKLSFTMAGKAFTVVPEPVMIQIPATENVREKEPEMENEVPARSHRHQLLKEEDFALVKFSTNL
jgi:glycosyltransferase involved in cell wall biosynthesis